MNNWAKNKKLLLILLLVLVVPLLVIVVRQIQELRGRVAGSGEVGLRFFPGSGTFNPGQAVTLKIALYRLANRAINISGAEAVVNVSDKFSINSVNCEPPFDSLPFTRISGQSITVMCAIASTDNPVAIEMNDLPFARLNLTVVSSAVSGAAPIVFTSTKATEANITGQAPDVSTAGVTGDFTIGQGGSQQLEDEDVNEL